MERKFDYDVVSAALDVVNVAEERTEKVRKAAVTTFETNTHLRGDLAVLGMEFLRDVNQAHAIDPLIAQQSENPMLDVLRVMIQLNGQIDDPLQLEFSGSMLDVMNVLFVKQIAKNRTEFPQCVSGTILRLDNLNLDHNKAGGLTSPVYAEYLRERQESQ